MDEVLGGRGQREGELGDGRAKKRMGLPERDLEHRELRIEGARVAKGTPSPFILDRGT